MSHRTLTTGRAAPLHPASAAATAKAEVTMTPVPANSNMLEPFSLLINDDDERELMDTGKDPIRGDHPLPPFADPLHPKLKIKNDELFAIVSFNGKQHKVGIDDVVMSTYIIGSKVGQKLTFDKVLLVGSRDFTVVGRPLVPSCTVTAVVEEHTMTKKINVFHMKRRAGLKRLMRYRDQVTMVRITDIKFTPQ